MTVLELTAALDEAQVMNAPVLVGERPIVGVRYLPDGTVVLDVEAGEAQR